MDVKLGILALLEAKPSKADQLADIATREEGTVTWHAFRVGESTYGIFDTSVEILALK